MLDREKLRYIHLSIIPGLGQLSQKRLLGICGSIDRCFELSDDELYAMNPFDIKRIGMARIRKYIKYRQDVDITGLAKNIYRKCEDKGIDIITPDDPRYPKRFENIEEMPLVLYAKGDLRINDYEGTAGIVGARRCTAQGKKDAIRAANDEISKGSAIVSGMAKGIDSYAHTAAIKAKGYTIAVLGNGPDICYPPEHGALYDAICMDGCVLSEYPPGTEPRRYMFPIRNRLIAGLSDRLYVIDAGRNSGANITKEMAKKYGREVL